VSVRPEDVELTPAAAGPAPATGANAWQGRVTEITDLGAVSLVCVALPAPLFALVTRRQRDELHICLGSPVSARCSPESVHVF
jgi:hypothetical protein